MIKKTKLKILTLFIINFLLGLILILPVRQLFYLEHNFSMQMVGIIMLSYQVSKLIFEIPTGYIGDVIGRKKSVITGLSLMMIAISLMVLDNYLLQIICSIILGLGLTFISGSLDALIYNEIKAKDDQKTMYRSNIFTYVEMIAVCLSYITSTLLMQLELYNMIIIESMLVLLVSLILLLLIKFKEVKVDEETTKKSFKVCLLKIIKNKKYLAMIVSIHTYTMVDIPFYAFSLVILKEKGLTTFQAGIAFAITLMIRHWQVQSYYE